jgi:hypothetical protein
VTTSASPSITTGSTAFSVVTTQRGSAARLRTLRDPRLLENQNAPSCQTPQTGMACGRPSGQRLATQ